MDIQQRLKEEMGAEGYGLESGRWETIEKGKKCHPKARYNHISFFFRNCFYVHGGHSTSRDDLQEETNLLYRYHLERNQWQKVEVDGSLASLQALSSHSTVVYKEQLIIFGGSNSKANCKNDLFSLSLETFTLKPLQQKGEIPSQRQSASMVLYKNDWLVLYGGISFDRSEIYNGFYFYNMLGKTWIRGEGNYQYLIQARSVPGFCLSSYNQKIYIFGGEYLNSEGQTKFLDDFYEVTPKIKNRSSPIGTQLARIITNNTPAPRSGHTLISFRSKYIVLLGGENFYTKQDKNVHFDPEKNLYARNDVWIYSIDVKDWAKIEPSGDMFRFRTCFSACQSPSKDKIYSFGGMKTYQCLHDDLMTLDLKEAKLQDFFIGRKEKTDVSCRMCHQRNKCMMLPQFAAEEEYVTSLVNAMDFPFAGFGLIFDNFILNGANLTNVSYEESVAHGRFIRIEDNGKLWPGEQMVHSIINFDQGIHFTEQGIDKRMKYLMVKDAQKKEFGINLKLGALRLGEQFLYVTQNQTQEEARVTYFAKEPLQNTDRYQYICYHYGFNRLSGLVLQGYSELIQEKVEDKFGPEIRTALQKRNLKNTLYIWRLRKTLYEVNGKLEEDYELIPHNNDLIYGNRAQINALQNEGYLVYECCDVSLRCYLTCLFLRPEAAKVFLSVRGQQRKEVPNQPHLEKIDRMVKNKFIIDLEGMIDHDCKIVEIYYNPDVKKKVQSFHNGVLIYHKGRLITRYKYKLGEFIQRNFSENYASKNNLVNFFGYIEVPDNVPVNTFKTEFTYSVMMEKLHSRIKLVWKFLERKNCAKGGIKNAMKKNQKIDKYIEKNEKNIDSKFKVQLLIEQPGRAASVKNMIEVELSSDHIREGQPRSQQKQSEMVDEQGEESKANNAGEDNAELMQQFSSSKKDIEKVQKISELKLQGDKKVGNLSIITKQRKGQNQIDQE